MVNNMLALNKHLLNLYDSANTEIIHFKDGLEDTALCSICHDTIESDSVCRKIKKCHHIFHIACIDQWLELKLTCPLCRHVIVRPIFLTL